MRTGLGVLAAVLCTALGGCGLILTGTRSTVAIDSYPQGAEVYVDGVLVGQTPLHTEVLSTEDHVVEVKAAGWGSKTLTLESRVHGLFVVLDVWWAFVPLLIDAFTKGWYVIAPDRLDVDLRPPPETPAAGASPGET